MAGLDEIRALFRIEIGNCNLKVTVLKCLISTSCGSLEAKLIRFYTYMMKIYFMFTNFVNIII